MHQITIVTLKTLISELHCFQYNSVPKLCFWNFTLSLKWLLTIKALYVCLINVQLESSNISKIAVLKKKTSALEFQNNIYIYSTILYHMLCLSYCTIFTNQWSTHIWNCYGCFCLAAHVFAYFSVINHVCAWTQELCQWA